MRNALAGLALATILLALAACGPAGAVIGSAATATVADTGPTTCPTALSVPSCLTPRLLREAYGVESLSQRGETGQGQSVVDIVSYGSPTLQADLDTFDQQFGLPATTLQVLAPLGSVPFDPTNSEMVSWAAETTLDVQLIHAVVPNATIVVLTSPVDETEGTLGLPQFLQLERYAVAHHLGHIFSQSWSASEATLADSAGQQLVQQFAAFYQQIVTQQGYIVVNASGDNGATDCAVINCLSPGGGPDPSKLATTPTVGFPADVPWVTTAGGTSLVMQPNGFTETAWSGSGGGVSRFFAQPAFQQSLPAGEQARLHGRRGIPDIAANANPETGMAFYCSPSSCCPPTDCPNFSAGWGLTGGTSAAAPVWAGVFAIADQMAGHPLGNVNPALYQLGAANEGHYFNDITVGDNTYVQGTVDVPGYQASTGWDLVTGWGSPRADTLLPALIPLAR
jgi:subtilase family serine protease